MNGAGGPVPFMAFWREEVERWLQQELYLLEQIVGFAEGGTPDGEL